MLSRRRTGRRAARTTRPALPLQDRRAVVMAEFAAVLPMLVLLSLAVFDLAQIWVVERRVTTASAEVAEIATNLAIQASGTNQLSYTPAFKAISAIYAYFPRWMTDPGQTFSVTLSSVKMVGLPAGCTGSACTSYVAQTAWSLAGSQNQPEDSNSGFTWDPAQARPCGALASSGSAGGGPGATPNYGALHSLPAAVFGPASLVIADVSVVYRPLFLGFITGPVTFLRSTFVPPRIGSNTDYVPYTAAQSDPATICPGYQ